MSTRDICYYTQNYSGPEYTNHPPVFLPLLGVVHAMTPQTLHQLFGQSQVLHTTTCYRRYPVSRPRDTQCSLYQLDKLSQCVDTKPSWATSLVSSPVVWALQG